jgi:hypothetical protein
VCEVGARSTTCSTSPSEVMLRVSSAYEDALRRRAEPASTRPVQASALVVALAAPRVTRVGCECAWTPDAIRNAGCTTIKTERIPRMDRQDALDTAECLEVCPLDPVSCARVCERATAVRAQQRGMPFYVPFKQAPLEDWAPDSPGGANWEPYDAPDASFAPGARAAAPWGRWNLPAPPLSRAAVQRSNAQCHRRCDAQAAEVNFPVQQGESPCQLYAPPLLSRGAQPLATRVACGECLAAATGPSSVTDAQVPWQLSPSLRGDSFRANHIPIRGQPVAFWQALPSPLPTGLCGRPASQRQCNDS